MKLRKSRITRLGVVIVLPIGVLASGAYARADDAPPTVDVPTELGASAITDGLEATSVAAGRYGAEHGVTPQGAFTYKIPIEAAPARGGFAPDLSLVYSSLADDGLAGMGWSLNGISAIHRVQGRDGIHYNGLDTYAANFGAWGTAADPRNVLGGFGDGTLHTLEDTNAQYIPSGQCGDGPCYWTMHDGRGTTYVYGDPSMTTPPHPSKGQIVSPALWELNNGAGVGQRGIFMWSLSKMTDVHGNTISFTYVDPTGNGTELVPTRIVYSTHATQSVAQSNEIDIAYEHRPDVTAAPYRFDSRPTKIDVLAGGQLVRRYALTYWPSPVSERSLLHSVQLVGIDGTTAEQPTVFTYSFGHNLASGNQPTIGTYYAGTPTQFLVGDFNGDGIKDLAILELNDTSRAITVDLGQPGTAGLKQAWYQWSGDWTPNGRWTAVVGDVDGNGRDDIVFVKYGNGAIATEVALGSLNGVTPPLGPSADTPWGPTGSTDYKACDSNGYCAVKVIPTDIDGDHNVDIVWYQPQTHALAWALSRGIGFDPPHVISNWNGGVDSSPDSVTPVSGDFNGDGRLDFASFDPKSHQASFALSQTIQLGNLQQGGTTQTGIGVPVDFNGDRRTDIATAAGSNIQLTMGHSGMPLDPGAGPTYGPLTIYTGIQSSLLSWVSAGDFNGDGNGDVLLSNIADASNPNQLDDRVYLGGPGGLSDWASFPYTNTVIETVADTNGDGRSEIISLDMSVNGGTVNAATVSRMGQPLTPTPLVSSLNIQSWYTPLGTVVGDFNGDGMDDVMVVSESPVPFTNGPGVGFEGPLSEDGKPDLLVDVVDEIGSHVHVDYVPNTYLSDPIQTDNLQCGGAVGGAGPDQLRYPEPSPALPRDARHRGQRTRIAAVQDLQLRQRPLHPIPVVHRGRSRLSDGERDGRPDRRRDDHRVPPGLALHRKGRISQDHVGQRDDLVRAERLRLSRRGDPATGASRLASGAHLRAVQRAVVARA